MHFYQNKYISKNKRQGYAGKAYMEHTIYLACIFDMLSLSTQ